MHSMKQTTIYLPDELKERLERAAAKAHCSEAALLREGWDDRDIAQNVDEHLARTGRLV